MLMAHMQENMQIQGQLRSHVVCLSVSPSVCDVGGL